MNRPLLDSHWWRALVLAAAVGLTATGCGDDDASPPPASAAPSTTPSPGASAAPAAVAFQSALDRLVIDRAIARTDRAEAAAEFNREGSDRPKAMEDVKAACARLLNVHTGFDEAMRQIAWEEPAKGDADAVLGATGTLLGVFAKYAEATATEQFAQLNSDEQVANDVWEQTVAALAQTLGTRGIGPAPTATPSGAPPTESPTESPSEEPAEEPAESPSSSPSP
jgi:hypothetical protein